MQAATTTCDHCLFGRGHFCAGPGRCANWRVRRTVKPVVVEGRVVRARPHRAERGKIARGGKGAHPGITPEQWDRAAQLLLEDGATYRGVASAVGCTYEQARTVQRNLKALAA